MARKRKEATKVIKEGKKTYFLLNMKDKGAEVALTPKEFYRARDRLEKIAKARRKRLSNKK